MIIKFRKGIDKPGTLTCVRPDGSTTWTKLHPGIEMHDFAHFVVETELGFPNAFYGIVAKGFDIGDFELPREQRPVALKPVNLPVEALQTEHIVNLLQTRFPNSNQDLDFITTLKNILTEKEIDFPKVLDQEKLNRINERLRDLLFKWNELENGGTLELEFDPLPK